MPATKDDKAAFNDAVKEPKKHIEESVRHTKEIMLLRKKHPNIAGYYNLEMAMENLRVCMYYLNMNDASTRILQLKNSKYLDEARKSFSNALLLLEEIVGKDIDRPLVDNKDYLRQIDQVNIRNILQISKKLLYNFDTMVDREGDNSKWKWQFVDLYVRVATVIKNMINFSEIEKFRNFRSEFFQDREDLLKTCKMTLEEAAKKARTKYENATQVPQDINNAIYLLSALRQINSLLGEAEEASKHKTVIDALRARLEEEEKKNSPEAKKKKK